MDVLTLVFIVVAYLLGSISTAIIVCKLMNLPDPRLDGSGNPGATNVLRIGGEKGKKAAAITLFGDMLKGLLPVVVAHLLELAPLAIVLVGFAAFIGHLYPLFFGFKGGKGVATMLGVMFGLSLPIGLAVAGTWLFVAKVLKISSLSALVATILAPVYIYYLAEPDQQQAWITVTAVMTLILFWRHRSNIQRLLRGEESLIKAAKDKAD
ncbi:glycerol-3-phosphate 1-O-acyltransferase PlsY [Thiomicrorhabdus sediminis]|uniref:Glycerol-3-phosphate acyltransferase n=1 Tax=Thiomicrorhabdus sediminis TaxID=2580412 RepID=A0A4P9K717_9GAMM|nr:glycerol-3-phosphate 1-O-acyltransferase PlsY [Thiomicrorhabdus sediminis]QCU90819.1 glycerol-3-phosphate 1-O-acyltransferase PlsY [Thiomicrorhabdus sediminis]